MLTLVPTASEVNGITAHAAIEITARKGATLNRNTPAPWADVFFGHELIVSPPCAGRAA
jgi:hypothetical protein